MTSTMLALGWNEPVFFGRPFGFAALIIAPMCGIVGLFTNWVCVQMMFHPMTYVGVRTPWQVRGLPVGGWQGVIPARAGLMASIICDTAIMKLGELREFYDALDPQALANRMVELMRPDVHRITDEIIEHEYPDLWKQLPPQLKDAVHQRVEAELPAIVSKLLTDMGENVEKLVDLKLMVVKFMQQNPDMVCKIFKDVGGKEFRYLTIAGFTWGLPLGLLPLSVYLWLPFIPDWFAIPVGGAVVGYLTNWIALKRIFEPDVPKEFMGREVLGLFIKRQPEVSKVFSRIVAQEVMTLATLINEMFTGPSKDRTRRMIHDAVQPVVDKTVGIAKPMVAMVAGRSVDHMATELANPGGEVDTLVGKTLADEKFLHERQDALSGFMCERMTVLPGNEFCAMLRAGIKKDEWILTAVGAVLGLAVGVLQVFVPIG